MIKIIFLLKSYVKHMNTMLSNSWYLSKLVREQNWIVNLFSVKQKIHGLKAKIINDLKEKKYLFDNQLIRKLVNSWLTVLEKEQWWF